MAENCEVIVVKTNSQQRQHCSASVPVQKASEANELNTPVSEK